LSFAEDCVVARKNPAVQELTTDIDLEAG
jgi:hypothetical protein